MTAAYEGGLVWSVIGPGTTIIEIDPRTGEQIGGINGLRVDPDTHGLQVQGIEVGRDFKMPAIVPIWGPSGQPVATILYGHDPNGWPVVSDPGGFEWPTKQQTMLTVQVTHRLGPTSITVGSETPGWVIADVGNPQIGDVLRVVDSDDHQPWLAKVIGFNNAGRPMVGPRLGTQPSHG